MQEPRIEHWTALKHLMCYLFGTLDKGINIHRGDQLAGFLTKPLSRPRLDLLLSKIGLFDKPSILREHVEDKN